MSHKMGLVRINITSATPYNTKYKLSTDNNYVWYSTGTTRVYSSMTYTALPSSITHLYPASANETYYAIVRANSSSAQNFTFTTSNSLVGTANGTNNWTYTANLKSGQYAAYTASFSVTYLAEASAHVLQIGDIYYSDGAVSRPNSKYSDKTPIGIVAYIANNAYTEKNYGGGHALVMSKKDIGKYKWKTSNTESDIPNVGNNNMGEVIADASGYYNSTHYLNSTTYPAAYYALRCSLPYPTGKCTGWFLPTIGQWYYTFVSLGQMPTNTFDMSGSNDQVCGGYYIIQNINTALSKLGTKNTDYEELLWTNAGGERYWASQEYTAARAYDWGYMNQPEVHSSYVGINIGTDPNNKTIEENVRPFLAF